MNSFLEILNALACISNIGILLLEVFDRWKEYRHRRIVTGEKEKTG